MRSVIRAAPAGVESFWMIDPDEPDLLVICVNDDLDRLARQRYIRQAELEHGVEQQRRRRLVAPLFIAAGGARRAAIDHKAGTATAAGVVAVAAAAVVAVPLALHHGNENSVHRRPAVAAPAVPSPDRRGRQSPPADDKPRPRRSVPPTGPADTPTLPQLPVRAVEVSLPTPPVEVPPIVVTPPAPPVKPPLPHPREQATVRLDLGDVPLLRLQLPLPLSVRVAVLSAHAHP